MFRLALGQVHLTISKFGRRGESLTRLLYCARYRQQHALSPLALTIDGGQPAQSTHTNPSITSHHSDTHGIRSATRLLHIGRGLNAAPPVSPSRRQARPDGTKKPHLAVDIGPPSAPVCAAHGPHTIRRCRNRVLEHWRTPCSTDPVTSPGTTMFSCLAAGTLSPPLSQLHLESCKLLLTVHMRGPPRTVVGAAISRKPRLASLGCSLVSLGTRHISGLGWLSRQACLRMLQGSIEMVRGKCL